MILPEIKNFAEVFAKLPSIGPRMAIRLAYAIASLNQESQDKLTAVLNNLKKINRCPLCLTFKLSEAKNCAICSDKRRDQNTILVIEKETELHSIENNLLFNGTYFVFGPLPERGLLSDQHQTRIKLLKNRLLQTQDNKADELILALPQTPHGLMVKEILKQELYQYAKKITELARGLPSGADLEFIDSETLKNAIDFRR